MKFSIILLFILFVSFNRSFISLRSLFCNNIIVKSYRFQRFQNIRRKDDCSHISLISKKKSTQYSHSIKNYVNRFLNSGRKSSMLKNPTFLENSSSIGKKREPIILFLTFIGVFLSMRYTEDFIILPTPISLIHYGTYCGPGPGRLINSPPVDAIDSICKVHDMDYDLCLPFSEENNYKGKFPSFINQLISIRGILPPPIRVILKDNYKGYTNCIHRADRKLVSKLEILKNYYSKDNIDPTFCFQFIRNCLTTESKASKKSIIINSYDPTDSTTCAIGLKAGGGSNSNKMCLISSRSLFISLALDLFDSDIQSDKTIFDDDFND